VSAKMEMAEVMLSTKDEIIVVDPEAEVRHEVA